MGYPIGKVMFENVYSFYAVLSGAVLVFGTIYIPPVNEALGTNWRTSPIVIGIAVGFGVVLFIYSVIRTTVLRSCNFLLI